MNAIEQRNRIDFYNDLTRNARFFEEDYNSAVNASILAYIDQALGNGIKKGLSGFQYEQFVRDRLYTIIKTNSPTLTPGTVINTRYGSYTPVTFPFPIDYQNFVSLKVLIDSYSDYSRPTNYNEEMPIMNSIFLKPTNKKTYYNENATGITVLRGTTGTFSSATLTYLKKPAVYNVGLLSQYISSGPGVLTSGASYIAVEESVQNSVTYLSGTQFTASGTNLTSGKVILASNTTACDLPESTHDSICKMASDLMLGVVQNYNGSAFVEKENAKNN